MEELQRRHLYDTAFRGGLSVVLYLAFPAFSDVYRLWERMAGNPDFTPIPFEYPPVSAFYFEPLTLLPSSRWAVAVNGLVMVVAAITITWILAKTSDRPGEEGPDMRLWMASPALILFLPINWDVFVALIGVLGVMALYENRQVLSGLWHGLGTAFKIFPGAVVLPVLPLIDGWRKRLAFLSTGFVSLVGGYLLYALVEPDHWAFHLDFASERSDIQSTIWGIFDETAALFGSQLSGDVINILSLASLVVSLALITWWVGKTRPSFAQVAALALIALLTFNKVFKPQYILWVIPFLAWIGADRMKVRLAEAATIAQFAAIYLALPAFIYPIHTAVRVIALGWVAADVLRSTWNSRMGQAL